MVVSERVRLSRIIALVGYCVLCCLCLLLLVYLRRNRHVAFKGDAQATRKVILPAYEPLLWLLAMVTGALAVLFCIALSTDMYTSSFPSIHGEIFYAGRQFVFVVALVFLCQKSVSVPALRRAVVMSIFLASYTIPLMRIIVFFAPQNMALFYYVRTVARVLVLIFVVNVCFINRPAGRASPSSLRTYGAYVIVYHMLVAVGTLTQMYALESRMHAATMYLMLIWGSITPLVIWNLLRADTEYWRGMGQRACDLQLLSLPDSYIQLDECISSDRIHSLIEMHKDFVIDFAHLNLRQKIGVGSSATIFSGRLQPRCPVAVKVYAPYRLTEEVVAEFSHEAALCASLIHPNIVKFYGMCVCPPSICLVFELCQGSLEDISCAQAQARSQRRDTRHQLGLTGKVKDAQTLDHQQMLVNVAYMLDCARAVAYIHSFSPPFLHRDIKTANFLVDNENNVKLTDFGDSRRLPENILKPGNGNDINGNESQTSAESSGFFSPVIVASAPPPIKMTVTGTVNYMAPEMISCRTGLASYGASADVYSLAITFWDILYPGRKKYAATNPLFVFEDVLNGCRPPLDATDSANPDATIPKRIRDIITSSWHSDPSARPTMPQIVRTLECIQKELLSVFVQDRSDDFKRPETGYHEITM